MPKKHWFASIAIAATLLAMGPAQAGPGDPLGPQFNIATQTGGRGPPQVARDSAGNFLAVWEGPFISARRYYANGSPQGAPFRVTPTDQPSAHSPSLGMSSAGDYVVAWQAYDPVDSSSHIYARSFDAAGLPRSAVLHVTQLERDSGYHSVAMGADGRFVVVWNEFTQFYGPIPGSSEFTFSLGYSSVRAKRYALDGSPDGANLLVGTSVTNPVPILGTYNAVPPTVAMNAQGGFVVAWEDKTAASSSVIYARRYGAGGLGGLKTRINPLLPLTAYQPTVAMDHAGNYLIGWHVLHKTGNNSSSGYDVWARRYSAAGAAQGAAFQVNAGAGGGVSIHEALDVALDPDGDAVVAWAGSPGNSCCVPSEIDLQRYSAAGAAQGGKTSVTPSGDESVRIPAAPSVAMDGYGNVVVVWYDLDGLQGRLYQAY